MFQVLLFNYYLSFLFVFGLHFLLAQKTKTVHSSVEEQKNCRLFTLSVISQSLGEAEIQVLVNWLTLLSLCSECLYHDLILMIPILISLDVSISYLFILLTSSLLFQHKTNMNKNSIVYAKYNNITICINSVSHLHILCTF